MKVTGWSNGNPNNESGGGYGVRISKADRDKYFDRDWETVVVELEQGPHAEVSISASFWRMCSELKSKDIGKWMLNRELAPWPKHCPPVLRLAHLDGRRFRLSS